VDDLEPTVEERQEFDWAWFFATEDEQRESILECFRTESPPPRGTKARDIYERVDTLARATIALRLLEAALDLNVKAEDHAHKVLDEAEVVRGELERADRVWWQADEIARGLVG
jgi:hypothetical protein